MASETKHAFPSLIYLMGYMGTGKSTIGQLLADELDYNFIDLDNYIEHQQEESISSIFKTKGEEYFRKLESNALKVIFSKKNIVIALGGGTPCFNDNIDRIKDTGMSVWLYASPAEIYNRIQNNDKRPLIQNITSQDRLRYIEKHMDSREVYYSKADILIDAEQEVEQVVTSIINKLNDEA